MQSSRSFTKIHNYAEIYTLRMNITKNTQNYQSQPFIHFGDDVMIYEISIECMLVITIFSILYHPFILFPRFFGGLLQSRYIRLFVNLVITAGMFVVNIVGINILINL